MKLDGIRFAISLQLPPHTYRHIGNQSLLICSKNPNDLTIEIDFRKNNFRKNHVNGVIFWSADSNLIDPSYVARISWHPMFNKKPTNLNELTSKLCFSHDFFDGNVEKIIDHIKEHY